MKLNILSDTDWESRIDRVLDELSSTGYRGLFEARDYGKGMVGIIVVFMCRETSLNFKQRIRFVKKERTLYLDIMLDLDEMRKIDHNARKRIVVERLSNEIPLILSKRSIPDFDEAQFVSDLKTWLKDIGWV